MARFNQFPCPLLVTDGAGQILEANADLLTLVGHTQAHWQQQPITALLTPESCLVFQTHVWPQLLREGRIDEIFLHLMDAKSQQTPVMVNCQKQEIGGIAHYYWVIFVAKERSRFEEALKQARNRAELMSTHLAKANAELNILHRQSALHANVIQLENRELTDLSQTDPLTGMANRRALVIAVALWRSQAALGAKASLLMVDVDHFKAVNDLHGHGEGDKVLASLALQLQSSMRISDLAVRYGGEEFVIWLPLAEHLGAAHAAQRIHEHVKQVRVAGHPITVSIGVATAAHTAGGDLLQLLIHNSDKALYEAKASGRDCTVHFASTV
jgi:sigma-B regulation protein RsbU (phosphoserine phosphatase)